MVEYDLAKIVMTVRLRSLAPKTNKEYIMFHINHENDIYKEGINISPPSNKNGVGITLKWNHNICYMRYSNKVKTWFIGHYQC